MCRVWMCKACGQVLPEGLRCLSLFGMMLLIIAAAITLIAWAIAQALYYGLVICFVLAAFGYLLTYGGIRVCSPSLIMIGTLFHFLLWFLLPAAIYFFFNDANNRGLNGNAGIAYITVLVTSIIYTLWELYYTLASCSAFALLNRTEC